MDANDDRDLQFVRTLPPGMIFDFGGELYLKLGDEWRGSNTNLVANLSNGTTRCMRWNTKVEPLPDAEIIA